MASPYGNIVVPSATEANWASPVSGTQVPQLNVNFGSGMGSMNSALQTTGNALSKAITSNSGTSLNIGNGGFNLYSNSGSSGITGSTGYGIGKAPDLNSTYNFTRASQPTSALVSSDYGLNAAGPVASQLNNVTNSVTTDSDFYNQILANQKMALQNQASNNNWNHWLGAGQLALGAFAGIGSYLNGKNYLKLARDQLAQQQNQFNETYNNQLKEYNTALADRLRARDAFETGDSTAYNDEITANSMQRGQTGNSSSDYLNYKRSSNADNPYNKDTKKETD